MKTMILATAAAIALGVGVAGSAFAEGEGGSATGAVQWHQADAAPPRRLTRQRRSSSPTSRRRSAPRKTTARANLPLAQVVAGPAGERWRGFRCTARPAADLPVRPDLHRNS